MKNRGGDPNLLLNKNSTNMYYIQSRQNPTTDLWPPADRGPALVKNIKFERIADFKLIILIMGYSFI